MSLVKIEPFITDNVANFTFGGLTITANAVFGNANLGNLATSNFVSVSSNITSGNANLGNLVVANYFSGNGYLLTGISAVTAVSLVNGNSNVVVNANSNVNISVGGTTNVAIITTTGANISGYLNATRFIGEAGNLSNIQGANVSGAVSSATTAGTVTTPAQPNITSLGLLANLSVSGNSSFIGNANIVGNLNLSTGNANLGNSVTANYFTGNGSLLSSITGGNVTGQVGNALIAGTVYTAAQPNITSVGTLTSLTVTGDISGANLTLSGNLIVNGSTETINSTITRIVDPIVEQGGGSSGAALSTNDNKDRGQILHYYTTTPVDAFMGWDNSNAEFAFGSNISVASEVITFNTFGNLRAGYFIGNGSTLTSIAGANVTGQVGNALIAGTVYTAAQPNITSVGTLTSLVVTGNITSGNANLGNNVTSNYFTGSGQYLTSVTAVTAATVTTAAQPNITSLGTLTTVTIGNATNNTIMNSSSITSNVNVNLTGSNISLGAIGNIKISGGTAGYFITTDGAGNLSWGAAAGGGGVSATGSNTQIQFNDGGVLGAVANLTFDKSTKILTVDRAVHVNGANLGSNVSNVYIGGGGVSQILATDGAGNLTWVSQPTATITVDNFTGDGTTTAFTLSTTPSSINQTVVNYNGAFQLRTSAYTLSGPTLTFTEAPANGSKIEVTTTMGSTSGAGAFVTRTYTGTGSTTNFTVTYGTTVSSVIVTENGLVQTPTTDYTISGSTLTFVTAPGNGVIIQIRELAIAIATTVSPAYRQYTGDGSTNTFAITSGLTANSLLVAENGVLQRPTVDYSISGSNVVFVTTPANGVDIQIRELSLNGGMSSGGISLPYQGGNSGKYLTTNGATASWSTVSALPTQTGNSGKYLTTDGTNASWATVSSISTGKVVALKMFLGI